MIAIIVETTAIFGRYAIPGGVQECVVVAHALVIRTLAAIVGGVGIATRVVTRRSVLSVLAWWADWTTKKHSTDLSRVRCPMASESESKKAKYSIRTWY